MKNKKLIRFTGLLCAMGTAAYGGLFLSEFPVSAVSEGAPVIFHVTDEVHGGEQFSINGEYMTPDSRVYISDSSGAKAELPVVQYDAADEQYLVCTLPYEKEGVWALTVENAFGTSEKFMLNGPRPLYMSEFEIWEGLKIDISGRNFDPEQFGRENVQPAVWLKNSDTGVKYKARLTETEEGFDYNNYRISFTVSGEIPIGEYEVSVRTANGSEQSLASGQTLTVLEKGDDPLGIGAAWADKIPWENVLDAKEYGAKGDGIADDTDVLKQAVSDLKNRGGGQLYLPEGIYNVTCLEIPDYVVLVGAGRERTELRYAATDDGNTFIVPAYNANGVGYTGIAELTIRNPYENENEAPLHSPDVYVQMGESDRGYAHNEYKNQGIFVKNVDIDYPMAKPQKAGLTTGKCRGLGLLISGSRVVVDGVNVKGFGGAIGVSNHSYARVQNSSFEYSITQFNVLSGYSFVMNNRLQGRREFIRAQEGVSIHGMMCRNDSHFEGNDIRGVGTGKNDGEVICVEVPGGNFGYGRVKAADGNSVALTDDSVVDFASKTQFGRFMVSVVDGKGKGQSVPAVHAPYGGAKRLRLLKPFKVLPDETSVVSLMTANENVTVYDNYGEDCCKSILMYGNVIDAIVSSNTLKDTDGIMVWGSNSNGQGLPADMYVGIVDNTVSGVSPLTKNTSIDVTSGRFISGIFGNAGAYSCTMVYSVDIRRNTVNGSPEIGEDQVVPNETEAAPWQAIVLNSCVYSSHTPKGERIGDLTNIVVTGNTVNNARTGIVYTHTIEGIVMQNNTFRNILQGSAFEIYNYNPTSATPSVNVTILADTTEPGDLPPEPPGTDSGMDSSSDSSDSSLSSDLSHREETSEDGLPKKGCFGGIVSGAMFGTVVSVAVILFFRKKEN